ncbi:hypothetical protein PRBRB14_18270 [Hallella multisaccharivorax DSM 17128]|nr:hypothetical protein PRBRB14_18270 [Hallella multisaccharivorax DSM 17128]
MKPRGKSDEGLISVNLRNTGKDSSTHDSGEIDIEFPTDIRICFKGDVPTGKVMNLVTQISAAHSKTPKKSTLVRF